MSKKVFVANEEQKKEVLKKLSKGELAQAVRLDIINPESKKPINLDVFCREFAEEIKDARAKRGSAVTSNLFNAATYVGKNKVTGLEERDPKSINLWLSLDGRGLFGKKFDLDVKASLPTQIRQVKQACADGLIGTQEMTGFVDAICKEMQLVEFQQIKDEFIDMKKAMGVNKK